MMQRDICIARFDPAMGSDQQGQQPVVIISGDAMNEMTDLCIVCPLITKIKNYPGAVLLEKNLKNGLAENSQILIFQVRVISKERLIKKIGAITLEELSIVKSALMDVLTY